MNYLKTTFDELVEDAKQNGNIPFLKKTLKNNPKISYLELKRLYFLQYYPNQVPKAKEKAKTFRDIIAEL